MLVRTRAIAAGESIPGERVDLRLVTLDDCNDRYVAWLQDPEVNRYLETRWRPQTLESVRAFVQSMLDAPDSYLFAILERESRQHVGNIKIGPIRREHSLADISFFIGERAMWGRGLATDAIRTATAWAFQRLGLRLLEAGLYAGNVGSARALERAGYTFACAFPARLRGPDGFEDHVWYQARNPAWTDAT